MLNDFFERLVGDVDQFTSKIWLQAPLVRRGALPSAPVELLTMSHLLQTLTSSALRHPNMRMVKSGKPVDRRLYLRRVKLANESVPDAADPDRILREFSAGATIVIDGLEDFILEVRQACEALGRVLLVPVHAHVFATPPGETGFAPHHDDSDVFVVQIYGSKKWKVYDRASSNVTGVYGETELSAPVIDTVLQAGDVLYIPRGAAHVATAPEVMSVHVSFVCQTKTWASHLQPLIEEILKTPSFQEAPNLFVLDKNGFNQELTRVSAELHDKVTGEADIAERDRATPQCTLSSVLHSMVELAQDAPADVTISRHQPMEVTELQDGTYQVEIPGARLKLPRPYGPALSAVAQRESFQMSDLHSYISPRHARALVGRLAAYGVVATGP
ncbi:JmjC domain-containing protein [Streptomyces sp. NPDC099088]|uniref:JmjC domain-containing protein n=1 Tax=Streptomyces sp. NPDC099088 TaxID=3366101 RepID=UPI0037FB616A